MLRELTITAISLLQGQDLLGPKHSESGPNIIFSCPFVHNHGGSRTQKTPSFSIHAEEGLWHCFSCKAGGRSIYDLYAALTNVSPDDAERMIGKPENILGSLESSLTELKAEDRDPFCKTAWPETVPLETVPAALAYIRGRGLPDWLWKLGDVSYYPGKFMPPELAKGDAPSWVSGQRIIFPLTWRGRRIGYSARTMNPDGVPKYYRPVERVGHAVYNPCGVNPSDCSEVYAVEGEIDALVSNREGLPTVGLFGSNISTMQGAFLAQFKHVRLMLDPDNAGMLGMAKGLRMYDTFMDAMPVFLPKGMDPGSMPLGFGESIKEAVAKADAGRQAISFDDLQRRLLDTVRL